MVISFHPHANVTKLPWVLIDALCRELDEDAIYLQIIGSFNDALRHQITAALPGDGSSPSERVLLELGNIGTTAQDLLVLLDTLQLERPQLLLRRQFRSVQIVEQPGPSTLSLDGENAELSCKAVGFPYPRYQWLQDDNPIPQAHSPRVTIDGSKLGSGGTYCCVVYNEITDGQLWSASYRGKAKKYSSEVVSDEVLVKILPQSVDAMACQGCMACLKSEASTDMFSTSGEICCEEATVNIRCTCKHADDVGDNNTGEPLEGNHCIATDKVALIISNSEYENLPPLLTPVADAECLANGLLQQGFKTVSLADLNLTEMRAALKEYGQLLGAGVYAVFYFVGHGFEFRGQCYLLPVDAPASQYHCSHCLCAEEVLSMMQETNPFLNVILLDMCRRYPPKDLDQFSEGLVNYMPKVNRNTVFGYATSFGEGAYEVLGEANGLFMKYLQNYLHIRKPVTEILSLVMRDLESDPKACQVQFPELRTNLSRPRGLCDPLNHRGYTTIFGVRTVRWQMLHEIPQPKKVAFQSRSVVSTIWFDFCGHFTNMIYLYCSVSSNYENQAESSSSSSQTAQSSQHFVEAVSTAYLATVTFPEGSLCGTLELREEGSMKLIEAKELEFADLLISRLGQE